MEAGSLAVRGVEQLQDSAVEGEKQVIDLDLSRVIESAAEPPIRLVKAA